MTTDCLVIGGGVVGLSIAYQLAGDGFSVRLADQRTPGREASWAGAGILPPGSWFSAHPAMIPVAALSYEQHPQWSASLREATGIDDEFETRGGLYTTPADMPAAARAHLAERLAAWTALDIPSQPFSAAELVELEPGLAPAEGFLVPGESQVRNPRRLAALVEACRKRDVVIEPNAGVRDFRVEGDQIRSVISAAGEFSAGSYLLTAGAWTGGLGERLGLAVPTTPIRGQMVLLRSAKRCLERVYHRAGRYLVPRSDGRVLVGSTVEQVGFDKQTHPADVEALIAFARREAPCLRDAEVETTWSGLRPASGDGLPMIGRLPRLANGWIAAGHFRSGLQFAPATAIAVSQLLRDESPAFDLAPFSPARFDPAVIGAPVEA